MKLAPSLRFWSTSAETAKLLFPFRLDGVVFLFLLFKDVLGFPLNRQDRAE